MAEKILVKSFYKIPELNDEEYSCLVSLITGSRYSFIGGIGGLPPISIAKKLLTKEDCMRIYQIDEQYYNDEDKNK